jgi:hypothetical protein
VSRRAIPTLLAGTLGLAYAVVTPPSVDLAAELTRAQLFGAEGFGIWSNWWYAGHDVVSYSVLFAPLAWLLTPQLVGAIAATGTAALFEQLAYDRFGDDGWLGSVWFAVATATTLLSGRLTFALGLLPALATALALARGRPPLAALLAAITALASPVAALFAALTGAATAIGADRGRERLAGAAVVLAALAPVAALAVAFPEGGREPFAFSALWPIPLIAALLLVALGRERRTPVAAVLLYLAGCVAAYLIPTPVGGNATRLAPLLAGPLLALVWWRRHTALLALAAVPLLYLQWQAAIRDVATAAGSPTTTASYYAPLLRYLRAQGGPPFRIEIPFTATHWEAYEVAPQFALARGWERQLDIEDNPLFYGRRLTAAAYGAWLHRLAVRFVAVPDAALDYSARRELAVIDGHPSYLSLAATLPHWRVYAVAHPAPIVAGAATLRALGPNSLSLRARRGGRAVVRVRYSSYWKLAGPAAAGACVAPAGRFTAITLRRPGPLRLEIDFALDRIGAHSPRCG